MVYRRYTILCMSFISLISFLCIILGILYKNYFNIIIALALPVIGINLFICKLFKEEKSSNDKYIKKAYILNYIFIILCGILLVISNFKDIIWGCFLCLIVLSIAHTIVYGLVHEHLIKITKKYVFVYLMLAIIIMITLIMVYVNVPKEYLAIRLSESTTIYDIVPYIIGAKLIVDVLLSLGIFPSLAW